MKKRLSIVTIMLILLVGLCAGCDSFKNEGSCGEDLNWNLSDDGDLTITGTGSMYNSSYENVSWGARRSDIDSITIADGATVITSEAFRNCTKLTSVFIPSSITSIEDYAFDGCEKLEDIYYEGTGDDWFTLVDSVDPHNSCLINAAIHFNSDGLNSADNNLASGKCGKESHWCLSREGTLYITGTGDIYNEGRLWTENSQDISATRIANGITSIGSYAFADCTNLTSVNLPESVTSIGFHAFAGCSSLSSVSLAASVMSIDGYAFEDCTSLTTFDFPATTSKCITGGMFSGCTNLTSISIPGAISSVEDWAFWNCNSLTDVYYNGYVWNWYAMQTSTSVDAGNGALLNANVHLLD